MFKSILAFAFSLVAFSASASAGVKEWNSRVLPKPGRKEMFVGKPIGILNPQEVVIDPLLLLEMQKIIGMMIPWNLTEG